MPNEVYVYVISVDVHTPLNKTGRTNWQPRMVLMNEEDARHLVDQKPSHRKVDELEITKMSPRMPKDLLLPKLHERLLEMEFEDEVPT